MKKIFLLISGLFLFIGSNVFALNRFDVDQVLINDKDPDLKEEINPIYEDGLIKGFNINIIIPDGYDKDLIVVSPSIFSGINNYKHLIPGAIVYVNLSIINKSSYNYKYVNNSFKISTLDLTTMSDKDNYKSIGKGFDKFIIYDNFLINRVYNDAIKALYNDEYKPMYLDDDVLNSHLVSIGYSLDTIDEYFLDYFNNKYNLDEVDLNNFTYSVIKEIFTGDVSSNMETNKNINSLAYNYYYNKLLYVLPDGVKIDQFESDDYSIGEYMRNAKLKDNFKFSNFDSGKVVNINNIGVGINKYYYCQIFDNYSLMANMEFSLEKDKYITPPNTGM